MKLTSKGKYALCAVLDLASNSSSGKPVRLKEISERQQISLHYLEQLFRRLRTGGVVNSVRGPGGGYLLAKGLGETSVLEVLSSVGEVTSYASGIKLAENPTAEAGLVSSLFAERLDATVTETLRATTLETLLATPAA